MGELRVTVDGASGVRRDGGRAVLAVVLHGGRRMTVHKFGELSAGEAMAMLCCLVARVYEAAERGGERGRG